MPLNKLSSLGCTALLACTVIGSARCDNVASQPPSQPYHWKNVEIGGGGGFITGILFSPKTPNLIYIRTDIGGAYRWDVKDNHWIPLTDWVGQADGNLRGAESLAIDPVDSNRVYLAAGTYSSNSPTAILRSRDQGRSWKESIVPLKMGGNEDGRSIGERLTVDPNSPNILYFGSRHDGLWRSDDYAATWSKVVSFPTITESYPPAVIAGAAPSAGFSRYRNIVRGAGVGIVLFDPRSGPSGKPTQVIFAGIDSPSVDAARTSLTQMGPTISSLAATEAIYRSSDSGMTWLPLPGQPTGLFPHHMGLTKDGILYVSYGNRIGPSNMSDGAVWKFNTTDSTWTDITPIKPTPDDAFGYAGLTFDPQNPRTVMVSTLDRFVGGDEIFRSLDGGAHWEATRAKAVMNGAAAPWLNWGKPAPSFGWWMGALSMDPFHPNRVFYGTGATIWGTDDIQNDDIDQPTHWTSRAEGIEETAAICMVSPPSGAHLISGLGDIGGFRHDRLNATPSDGMSTPIFTTTTSIDFAQNFPQDVVRAGSAGQKNPHGCYSSDGGTTWKGFASEPQGSRGSGSIAITANANTIVWIPGGTSAAFSHDWGGTWSPCSGLPAPTPGLRGSFGTSRLVVVADRVNGNNVYIFDTRSAALYRSTDTGTTFSLVTTNLPGLAGSLTASLASKGDLWVTMNDHGLYHSMDSGSTFTVLPNVQEADGIGFGKAAPGTDYPALYITGAQSGVHGVFRSDDEGISWVRINDDQHQYGWIGQPITGDPRIYGRVYLGTNGRGILYADPVSN